MLMQVLMIGVLRCRCICIYIRTYIYIYIYIYMCIYNIHVIEIIIIYDICLFFVCNYVCIYLLLHIYTM